MNKKKRKKEKRKRDREIIRIKGTKSENKINHNKEK